MIIYDHYIAGKTFTKRKTYTNPGDHIFIDVYNKFISQKSFQKKTPPG